MSSEITVTDILNAYVKLSDDDKAIVDLLSARLEKRLKEIWREGFHNLPLNFGPVQAIELLGRLGVFFVQEGYFEPECTCTPRDDISCPACREKARDVYEEFV